MFEALKEYQKGVAEQLQDQITSGTMSQVNLFGGSRYSLRMSFALETARVLSCYQGGDDHCSCESCRKFRNLTVSNVVIISQRDHRSVIETSLSTFERLYNDFSRQFVIQSIRRMLLQYHPALLSGAQTQSQNAAASLAGQVNDLLVDLARMEIGNASQAKKAVKELRGALKGLFTAAKKNTTVTISQVRALEHWSGQTSMGDGKRFIILEAMEMTNSSARNSLLKMLEEPAKDTYYFLISEYPNRIIQTILSRVRRYAFPPLSREAVGKYLQPFYLHDKQYDSLESFFLEGGGMDLARATRIAELFVASVQERRYLQSSEIASLLKEIDDMQGYEFVLKAMLESLRRVMPPRSLLALSSLVNTTYNRAQLYNQNNRLMLESLYYQMMEEA
jgi:DNA polymerase-3 subunit gamma/tau